MAQPTPALPQPTHMNIPPVASPAIPTPATTARPELPETLGGFGKKILILCKDAEAKFLTDVNFDFLTKVLGSVKVGMQDIYLINIQGYPTGTGVHWLNHYQPAVVLLLDVPTDFLSLPMRFPHFQVQPWGNTIFLSTPPLATLNGTLPDQVAQKRQLWEALKRIFIN